MKLIELVSVFQIGKLSHVSFVKNKNKFLKTRCNFFYYYFYFIFFLFFFYQFSISQLHFKAVVFFSLRFTFQALLPLDSSHFAPYSLLTMVGNCCHLLWCKWKNKLIDWCNCQEIISFHFGCQISVQDFCGWHYGNRRLRPSLLRSRY